MRAQTAVKKTAEKAVGSSRGGKNTKIHALVDGLGNPLAFLLSSGNDHDSVHAIPLLKKLEIAGSNILGDKAYGAKIIRDYISSQNATYTIEGGSLLAAPLPYTAEGPYPPPGFERALALYPQLRCLTRCAAALPVRRTFICMNPSPLYLSIHIFATRY